MLHGPVRKPSSTSSSVACQSFMSCSGSPEDTVAAMERALKDLAMDLKKFSSNSGARTRAGKTIRCRKPAAQWKTTCHLSCQLHIWIRNLLQELFEQDCAFAIQYAPHMGLHVLLAFSFLVFQVCAHSHQSLCKCTLCTPELESCSVIVGPDVVHQQTANLHGHFGRMDQFACLLAEIQAVLSVCQLLPRSACQCHSSSPRPHSQIAKVGTLLGKPVHSSGMRLPSGSCCKIDISLMSCTCGCKNSDISGTSLRPRGKHPKIALLTCVTECVSYLDISNC